MKTVSAAYAKVHLPELLKLVQKGRSVVIARYNHPVAVLSPAPDAKQAGIKFGTGKGRVQIVDPNWAAPMTDEEADAFLDGQ